MVSSTVRLGSRILGWQVVGTVLLFTPFWWIDARLARSVCVGGGIGIIASAYLVFVQFKHVLQPARPATVVTLFINWFVKTMLVLGLLMVAMRSSSFKPPALLLGLAMSLVCYWLAAIKRPSNLSGSE